MGRFQRSNPSQYGAGEDEGLSPEQVSGLIAAGKDLYDVVSDLVPEKKAPAKKPAKKKKQSQPAPRQSTTGRTPPKSNTALWVGGGVATLAILGLAGWAISSRR